MKEHEGSVPTGVNGLHKAFICGLNQLLGSLIHLSDKKGFVEVTMETVVVDSDVHCVRDDELCQSHYVT